MRLSSGGNNEKGVSIISSRRLLSELDVKIRQQADEMGELEAKVRQQADEIEELKKLTHNAGSDVLHSNERDDQTAEDASDINS